MAYKFQIGAATLSGSLRAVDGLVSTNVDDTTAANIVAEIDAGEIAASKVGAGTFDAGTYSFAGSTISDLGTVTTADIDGGSIDGAAIGAASPSTAVFTTISGSGAAQFASLHVDSVNLDGGAIDGTIIGANSVAAGSFAALVGTSLDMNGAADFSSTLTVAGAIDANSTSDFQGAMNLQAGITVAGAADLNGALDVAGATSLAATGVLTDIRGTLSVNEAAVFDSTLSATGIISGSAALKGLSLTIAGNELISSAGNFQGNNADFADLTASAADFSGVSVMKLDSIGTLEFNQEDYMLIRDSGSMEARAIQLSAYASAIAGDGLAASSGVLAVGVDDSSIELDSDALRVKALGITNAMLAGSIVNAKLSNSTVSFGGVSLALGASDASPAFDLSDASAYPGDSSLVAAGALNAGSITSGFGNIDNGSSTLDAGASTLASLTVNGNTTINGNLTVTGSLTYVNTTNLAITDALITIGSGSSAYAADYGIEFGAVDGGWASLKTAVYDIDNDDSDENALVSSLPFRASEINADTFYGSFAMDIAAPADGQSFSIGMNVVADMGSDGTDTITLPASAASLIGKKVMIKAPSDCSAARSLLINTQASAQKIDGDLDSIRLESPHAAVTLVYVATNSWKVF